jgi:hypothetical protein
MILSGRPWEEAGIVRVPLPPFRKSSGVIGLAEISPQNLDVK